MSNNKVMRKLKLKLSLCLLPILAAIGCTTDQTTAAYKGANASDLAVTAAMTGWGAYVATVHPGTNAEFKVFTAFNSYKQAELALVDATASLASNPTNTAPAVAAQNALAAAQLDLVNLISSLTNGPTIKTNSALPSIQFDWMMPILWTIEAGGQQIPAVWTNPVPFTAN